MKKLWGRGRCILSNGNTTLAISSLTQFVLCYGLFLSCGFAIIDIEFIHANVCDVSATICMYLHILYKNVSNPYMYHGIYSYILILLLM